MTIAQHVKLQLFDPGAAISSKPYIQPLLLVLGILFCWGLRTLVTRQRRHVPQPPAAGPESPAVKAPSRTPGHWTPSTFRPPPPPPYPDWSLTATAPLPYRAFRHGPKYNVTMGLRTASFDDWIQLDNHYPKYHAAKAHRLATRGLRVARTAPEAMPAAVELLEELASYLPARYPSLFRRTPRGIDNLFSGESFDITSTGGPLRGKEDPIATCARLIQDDLALMIEQADGQYRLLSGAIVLPGFWRLDDKFGMPLSEIHTSGEVPQFRERLERGMLSFFSRLRCEQMYSRNNYFVQVDDGLAWSRSIGDEDGGTIGWAAAEGAAAAEQLWFRSERQTLRRLPRTGAVVFTVRTYFHPVTEIAREDYVPGRLASAVRSWGDDVARYKGRERYGDVLLEYLDAEHAKQLERGLDVSAEEKEGRGYPW